MTTSLDTHSTSDGHVLSSSQWLDAHFEACRDEYAAMLAWAGFEAGMGVLDAGCGTGSFVPLLRDGGAGEVLALDTAMEHLQFIDEQYGRIGGTAVVGGAISALPLANGSVDGVWCANTLQYLDDDDAIETLRDFGRVVRQGGPVAVKDVDMTAFKIAPAPAFLGAHLAEACATGPDVTPQSRGSLRGRELRLLMQRAGFVDVRQASFVIERWGPLSGADARFWSEWLPYLSQLAQSRGVPEEDLETWRLVATPELAQSFVTRDGFYGCELQVVCRGRRPR